MQPKVAAALQSLLEAEKSAILRADYDALGPISEAKENLLGQLSPRAEKASALRDIRSQIETNQALLQAAIKGVAAAKARVAALQHVRDELGIYDRSGRIAKVASRSSALEKKA